MLTSISLSAEPFSRASEQTIVQVSTLWSATGVKPGGHIILAVVLDIRKPYHINSDRAKDPLVPASIELLRGADSIIGSTAIFPQAEEIEFGAPGAKERIRVFSGRLVAYVPMAVADSAKPGKQEIRLRVAYQACDGQQCLFPAEVTNSADLTVVGATEEVRNINTELFEALKTTGD